MHMDRILLVFLIFFLFVGGIILTTTIQGLDTSNWNFTGSELAKAFIVYMPHIFLIVGGGVIILVSVGQIKK